MKKLMMFALVAVLFIGGMTRSYAQDDSATVAEQPKDTISIDNMDPSGYYSDEAPEEKSNTMTYAIIGGIVVIGGAAFFVMKKKKK